MEETHPLHEAAKRGNLEWLKRCLNDHLIKFIITFPNRQIPVNKADVSGSTPLYWASCNGHAECVQELLQAKGIDLNVQNKLGDTALHIAALKGHKEVVRMLLLAGARRDIRNRVDSKKPIEMTKDADVARLFSKIEEDFPEGDTSD